MRGISILNPRVSRGNSFDDGWHSGPASGHQSCHSPRSPSLGSCWGCMHRKGTPLSQWCCSFLGEEEQITLCCAAGLTCREAVEGKLSSEAHKGRISFFILLQYCILNPTLWNNVRKQWLLFLIVLIPLHLQGDADHSGLGAAITTGTWVHFCSLQYFTFPIMSYDDKCVNAEGETLDCKSTDTATPR